jgi:hypothetical protein
VTNRVAVVLREHISHGLHASLLGAKKEELLCRHLKFSLFIVFRSRGRRRRRSDLRRRFRAHRYIILVCSIET